MRHAQYDGGKIIAHYACAQSFPTVAVEDDHPDLLAYKANVQRTIDPPTDVRIAGTVRRSAYARGLTKVLAEKLAMSESELLQAIITAAREQPADAGTVGEDVDGG